MVLFLYVGILYVGECVVYYFVLYFYLLWLYGCVLVLNLSEFRCYRVVNMKFLFCLFLKLGRVGDVNRGSGGEEFYVLGFCMRV